MDDCPQDAIVQGSRATGHHIRSSVMLVVIGWLLQLLGLHDISSGREEEKKTGVSQKSSDGILGLKKKDVWIFYKPVNGEFTRGCKRDDALVKYDVLVATVLIYDRSALERASKPETNLPLLQGTSTP
ncbi:hypothetical protein PoB_007008900 [Plakobranchus ocellatus]|uniref:Uncharacterized protein n=1 Tax=Plakobranchus ocellatus TaxID=259542 RepID=A0AAV4DHD4_9GAST|nr:hypothetical protein PoB_007008900 [Plakobranchus ocellatus]